MHWTHYRQDPASDCYQLLFIKSFFLTDIYLFHAKSKCLQWDVLQRDISSNELCKLNRFCVFQHILFAAKQAQFSSSKWSWTGKKHLAILPTLSRKLPPNPTVIIEPFEVNKSLFWFFSNDFLHSSHNALHFTLMLAYSPIGLFSVQFFFSQQSTLLGMHASHTWIWPEERGGRGGTSMYIWRGANRTFQRSEFVDCCRLGC